MSGLNVSFMWKRFWRCFKIIRHKQAQDAEKLTL